MSTTSEVFRTSHLNAHNRHRTRHGCPPVRLSDGLCNYAQNLAEQMAERRTMALQCDGCDFGQNIYMVFRDPPRDVPGDEPVERWYTEAGHYDFSGEGGFSTRTGHFTQLIWKATEELGVGRATNEYGETYVVTVYHPAGNVYGQFGKNVPPAGTAGTLSGFTSSRTAEQVKKQVVTSEQGTFSGFALNHLAAHNTYRAQHRSPPLELSQSLCQYAQEWANHIASRGVMEHRIDQKYGENIYMMGAASPPVEISGQKPVDAWYQEVRHFRFGVDDFSLHTGHFTQVVWRASRKLGVGKATNRKGDTFVVANYDPPGNYRGQFGANVLPK